MIGVGQLALDFAAPTVPLTFDVVDVAGRGKILGDAAARRAARLAGLAKPDADVDPNARWGPLEAAALAAKSGEPGSVGLLWSLVREEICGPLSRRRFPSAGRDVQDAAADHAADCAIRNSLTKWCPTFGTPFSAWCRTWMGKDMLKIIVAAGDVEGGPLPDVIIEAAWSDRFDDADDDAAALAARVAILECAGLSTAERGLLDSVLGAYGPACGPAEWAAVNGVDPTVLPAMWRSIRRSIRAASSGQMAMLWLDDMLAAA